METLDSAIRLVDNLQVLVLCIGIGYVSLQVFLMVRKGNKTNDYKVMNVKKHREEKEARKDFFKNLLS